MTLQPDPREFVGVGLYTIKDAAQLLKTPPRTVRRWVEGYEYSKNKLKRQVDPLWNPDLPNIDGTVELSFRDLIELRFVRGFIGMGIGLKAIRSCLDVARECVESDRPFSSGRFRTDGKTIFLEGLERSGDHALIDLKKQQYVFRSVVEQTFRDLDLENDIVTRWRPYKGKETIIIDPKRSFGQAIAFSSGVPTVVLADAVEAEGSVARVAALYEIEKSVVRDAVRFEEELANN